MNDKFKEELLERLRDEEDLMMEIDRILTHAGKCNQHILTRLGIVGCIIMLAENL